MNPEQSRWDFVAQQFDNLPIPQWGQDPFLHCLKTLPVWDGSAQIMDLGCGAGHYAIALAPRCRKVVGSDISQSMIAFANRKKERYDLANASFHCESWKDADIRERGYERRFDLVIAHMTPALDSLQALKKMNQCSKGYCAMAAHYQRDNPMQDELEALLGIPPRTVSRRLASFFSYLYGNGMQPQVMYYRRDDSKELSQSDALFFWKNRMRLVTDLTHEQEQIIETFVAGKTVEGILKNPVTSTIAAMVWNTKTKG